MINLDRLRTLTIRACIVCAGSGILPDDTECECSKEYKRLATLVIGHFPDEHISLLLKKNLGEVRIVEGVSALEVALRHTAEFLEKGMGIVVKDTSEKSKRSSAFLTGMVMDMLIRNSSLRCYYFDGCRKTEREDYAANILVIETMSELNYFEKVEVEKLLIQRAKSNLSTIIYIPGPEIFADWPKLGELLSWNNEENKVVDSRIYKQVDIKMLGGKSRWDNEI